MRAGALALALQLGAVTGARAAPQADPVAQKVERLSKEAAEAYRVADYQHAVELFERAYQLRQVGALLYNLAKAYEKLGNQEKAIEMYRRYAESTDSDPRLKTKAEARVATWDEAHRRVDPEPVDRSPRQPDERPVATPRPVDRSGERALEAWRRRRTRDRAIGLSMEGLAVVCAATGAGLWGSALVLRNRYVTSLDTEDAKRAEKHRALTRAVAGDALWGVAALAVGVGSYFVWRGYHKEKPPGPRAMAAAVPVPGGALFAVGGAF